MTETATWCKRRWETGWISLSVVALIGGSYYAAGFPTEGDALNNEVGDWQHIYIGYMQYESDSTAEMSNTIVF